jgi:hypothetical protein
MWISISVAAAFTWLGMVLAISFLETPVKFRAPGITIPLGLGIGRIVFRALNIAEMVLAAVVVVSLIGGPPRSGRCVAARAARGGAISPTGRTQALA